MPTFIASLLRLMRRTARVFSQSSLLLASLPLIGLVIVGTLTYSYLEGWSLVDSLYATVITVTTVGYGDITPETPAGRIFATIFTLVAIGFAGYAITAMASVVIEYETKQVKRRKLERRMDKIAALEDHMIICGASVVGHRAMAKFRQNGIPLVVVEKDEATLKWAMLWNHRDYIAKRQRLYQHVDDVDFEIEERKSAAELATELEILYLQEDPTNEQVLRRAGISKARGLVAALDDDRDNLSIVLSARDMSSKVDNEALRITARVSEEMNIRRMYLAGADHVTSPNMVGGTHMATQLISPTVGRFWDKALFQQDKAGMHIGELVANEHPDYLGQTVDHWLKQRAQVILAIYREERFLYAPDEDELIQKDDVLVVVGRALKTA